MSTRMSTNDVVLMLSLLYSSVDLSLEWEAFNSCRRPIHWWLLVSYICVVGFRLTHLAGARLAAASGVDDEGAGDFLVDLRQKGVLPRLLVAFTWLVYLPFFILCTLVGTSWLYEVVRDTPQCVPTASHLWFSGFWLALCYLSVFIYVALGVAAWLIERRVRQQESDLRQMEDADVLSRWGQVSQVNRLSLSAMRSGLKPEEIRALSGETVLLDDVEAVSCAGQDCAICITALRPGETVRLLPACGHAFHRSCVDLWLLRRADCPLCKRSVRSGT